MPELCLDSGRLCGVEWEGVVRELGRLEGVDMRRLLARLWGVGLRLCCRLLYCRARREACCCSSRSCTCGKVLLSCTHTSIHLYIHTPIHSYLHTSVYLYIHTSVHSYTLTFIHSYICILIYPYTHTSIHPYICNYTCKAVQQLLYPDVQCIYTQIPSFSCTPIPA